MCFHAKLIILENHDKIHNCILMTRSVYNMEVFIYKVDNPGKSMIISITLLMSPMVYCLSIYWKRWTLFCFYGAFLASKGYPFKNIFDFTTAGDWDCVAAVERLPALHYSVDFIFLSFGIMGFIVEL